MDFIKKLLQTLFQKAEKNHYFLQTFTEKIAG